jgi:hypothetical protein
VRHRRVGVETLAGEVLEELPHLVHPANPGASVASTACATGAGWARR